MAVYFTPWSISQIVFAKKLNPRLLQVVKLAPDALIGVSMGKLVASVKKVP